MRISIAAGLIATLLGLAPLQVSAVEIVAIDEAEDRIVSIDTATGEIETVVETPNIASRNFLGPRLFMIGRFAFVLDYFEDQVTVFDSVDERVTGRFEITRPVVAVSDSVTGHFYVHSESACPELVQIDPERGEIVRRIAIPRIIGRMTIHDGRVTSPYGSGVALWDLVTGEVLAEVRVPDWVVDLVPVPERDRLIVFSPETVVVLESDTLSEVIRWEIPEKVLAVASAGDHVAVITGPESLVFDVSKDVPAAVYEHGVRGLDTRDQVVVSPDLTSFLVARKSGGDGHSLGAYALDGRRRFASDEPYSIDAVTMSPDHRFVALTAWNRLDLLVDGELVGPVLSVTRPEGAQWSDVHRGFVMLAREGLCLVDPVDGSAECLAQKADFERIVSGESGGLIVLERWPYRVRPLDLVSRTFGDPFSLDDRDARIHDIALGPGGLSVAFGWGEEGILMQGPETQRTWHYDRDLDGVEPHRLSDAASHLIALDEDRVLRVTYHGVIAVVDMRRGRVTSTDSIGGLYDGDGVVDLAYDSRRGRVYMASVVGRGGRIETSLLSVFDTESAALSGSFSIAHDVTAIAFDDAANSILIGVADYPPRIGGEVRVSRDFVAIFDPSGERLGEIEVPGRIRDLLAVPESGLLIAALEADPSLVVVDLAKRRVIGGLGEGLKLASLLVPEGSVVDRDLGGLVPVSVPAVDLPENELVFVADVQYNWDGGGALVRWDGSEVLRFPYRGRLAIGPGRSVLVGNESRARKWISVVDGVSAVVTAEFDVGGRIENILPSPDGELVYVVQLFDDPGGVHFGFSVVDLARAKVLHEHRLGWGYSRNSTLSPNGRELIIASDDEVCFVDTRTGGIERIRQPLWSRFAFAGEELWLAGDQGLYVREAGGFTQVLDGELSGEDPRSTGRAAMVAAPDGSRLVVPRFMECGSDTLVVDTGKREVERVLPTNARAARAVSSDSRYLYVLYGEKGVEVWDLANGERTIVPVPGRPRQVLSGCFEECAEADSATVDWSSIAEPTIQPAPTATPTEIPRENPYSISLWVRSGAALPGDVARLTLAAGEASVPGAIQSVHFDIRLPDVAVPIPWVGGTVLCDGTDDETVMSPLPVGCGESYPCDGVHVRLRAIRPLKKSAPGQLM